MTIEITEKAQIVIKWFKNPLTKGYIDFLKYKNEIFTQEVTNLVEKAVIEGNSKRTDKEIGSFIQLRTYRESISDLISCFQISHKEGDLSEQDIKELEDFFETLTKNNHDN